LNKRAIARLEDVQESPNATDRIVQNKEASMVAPGAKTLDVVGIRLVTVLCNFASVGGFVFSIAERASAMPNLSGGDRLNVVLHLSVLTALAYGIVWSLSERVFGWTYGAGGGDVLPAGWSAIVLSLSVTLPLALIPFLYQTVTHVKVLLPSHWRAMFLVILLGAAAHLLVYGIGSVPGIRQRMAPLGEETPFKRALEAEALYVITYFGLIVLPYRLVVNPTEPLSGLLLWRIVIPGMVFFFGMTLFIGLKYPGSLSDRTWIQVRGVISGLVMMFCFCGAMFL
jgi:hypothetical protein